VRDIEQNATLTFLTPFGPNWDKFGNQWVDWDRHITHMVPRKAVKAADWVVSVDEAAVECRKVCGMFPEIGVFLNRLLPDGTLPRKSNVRSFEF
jgi:hypothetical protein